MIEAKVKEWNEAYLALNDEVRLKDLGTESYEHEVSYRLLYVCGGDVDLALAVFHHEENEGGWMTGDVSEFLKQVKKRRQDEQRQRQNS